LILCALTNLTIRCENMTVCWLATTYSYLNEVTISHSTVYVVRMFVSHKQTRRF
jgi:hypothetical protein